MSHVVQWVQEQLAALTVAGVEEYPVVVEEGQMRVHGASMGA